MNNSEYFKDVLLEYACFTLDEHSIESIQYILRRTAIKLRNDIQEYRSSGQPEYIQYLFGCKPSELGQIAKLERMLLLPLEQFDYHKPDSMLHSLNMIRAASYRSEHGDEIDKDIVIQDIVNSFVSLQKRPVYYRESV
jgi:hypothetical protein